MNAKITYAKISGYDAAMASALHADVHVIAAEGELGEKELTSLGDELVRLACAGKRNVVIDLTAAFHVDYREVRKLESRARFLRSAGGDLKLCGLSPYLASIFRAAGMWTAFDIHDEVEGAVASFTSAALEG